MGRIVLAADFSGPEHPLLDHAALLSRRLGAEAVLVHALQGDATSCDRAEAEGQRWVDLGCELGGTFSQTLILRFEEPARLVAVSARELDACCVVAGAGAGLGPVGRAILRRLLDRPLLLSRGATVLSGWTAGSRRAAAQVVAPLLTGLPEVEGPGDDVLSVEPWRAAALARVARVERRLRASPGPLLVCPTAPIIETLPRG